MVFKNVCVSALDESSLSIGMVNSRELSVMLVVQLHGAVDRGNMLNPFTLIAAKRGLTILEIFSLQKHFFENI